MLGCTSSQEYCTQALATPFLKQDVSNKMRAKVSENNLSPLNPHCYKIHQISSLDTFCRAKTLLHRRRAKFCIPPSGCSCPAQSEGPRWMRGSFELYPQIWVNSLSISSQICLPVYSVGHWEGPHFPNCFGFFSPRTDTY